MADSKLTALTALTGANVDTADVLEISDISDTTMDASGTSKKVAAGELAVAMQTLRRSGVLPTGAKNENFDRRVAGTVFTAVSQTVYLYAIDLPLGLVVTSVSFINGGTSLGGGSNQVFGLYDSSRNLLATTTDDTSTAWANATRKTLNLTPGTFTTTYSGLHYVAFLVKATTMPTPLCVQGSSPTNTEPPITGGASTASRTTLPNPAAAITADSKTVYCYVS